MGRKQRSDMELRREVEQQLGQPVIDITPLSGGCIGQVYRVQAKDGRTLVAKVDESPQPKLAIEAFMLRYLAEHSPLPVPAVVHSSDHLLLMEYIRGESHFSASAEEHAADLLAALHAITVPSYGLERDTLIGGLHQPNTPNASWLAFFRDRRLQYIVWEGVDSGRLPTHTAQRLDRLSQQLDKWLREPERPSLIHGDVWTTNVLATNGRITAFLDPAIYYADPEIELAFITLFDTFGRPFFERYHEQRPIAPGFFEERRHLYNLYPLLIHVRLFGGSYLAAVEQTLRRFGF